MDPKNKLMNVVLWMKGYHEKHWKHSGDYPV